MLQIRLLPFAALSLFLATASTPSHAKKPQKKVSGAITIGNSAIGVTSKGEIVIQASTSPVSLLPDSSSILPDGPTDLYIDPRLLSGQGSPVFGNEERLNPFSHGPQSDPLEFLNHLGVFFSTASGGFGFRINYDRKLSSHARLIASPEFLTYGFSKSQSILGDQMPGATTRISLMALPIGLQHHFSSKSSVNPYFGFGAGPLLRLDHRSPRPGYYNYGNAGLRGAFADGRNTLGATVPLYLDDFPSMSLTVGGHLAAGLNIQLGQKKDIALTLEGRYTLARFTDALGAAGDFSGYSLAVGFGKAF